MITQLLVRFVLGGLVVSLFAMLGEMWKPKTFAGLFGAAPSVALVALAISFVCESRTYVTTEGRSMIIGAIAMFVYCASCCATGRVHHVPVWLEAAAAWISWFATTFVLYLALQRLVLR